MTLAKWGFPYYMFSFSLYFHNILSFYFPYQNSSITFKTNMTNIWMQKKNYLRLKTLNFFKNLGIQKLSWNSYKTCKSRIKSNLFASKLSFKWSQISVGSFGLLVESGKIIAHVWVAFGTYLASLSSRSKRTYCCIFSMKPNKGRKDDLFGFDSVWMSISHVVS